MAFSSDDEVFEEAKALFIDGHYQKAEPLFNQLILRSNKSPEVFHMLATIYYDQGKFNKAIRTFRRAIEIDPSFTDASVGLSIVLNDLGRYDEGQKVFNEAKIMLERQSGSDDPYVNDKLALKHDELGELYFRYNRFDESLEQYQTAFRLSNGRPEIGLHVVEVLLKTECADQAIQLLKALQKDHPLFMPIRIKLGKVYYDSNRVPEAVSEWEQVLQKEPHNTSAKDFLQLANSVQTTSLAVENENFI
ncbi:MAG: tetratricopeptide repeat protein [Pseudobdellovibrionaceae bacterium]|nr:tetratricopeptide repeat protein [Bdellovibrionales bacterium]USN46912.1 MAG: tetratricopeptide repeat protein [Pseudobdellovibrionaceae bacterium]